MNVTSQSAPAHAALDLFCFSHLRWDFVTQRPQHLLREAAADRRVFYWEEPIWHRPGELSNAFVEVRRESEAIVVLRPHLEEGFDSDQVCRQLLDGFLAEHNITNFVAWYYTPMAYQFAGHLRPAVLVYDCMDELKNFANAPATLERLEADLLMAADVIFTGGRSLFEKKRLTNKNVHCFPSSVDVAHFASALRPTRTPEDQADIPQPRVGFYGVLDERLDLKLLADLSEIRPDLQFVMIGPTAKISPSDLPRASNIHYLGSKSYQELPSYLNGWDVAILPFALNEATQYISPTKTPEYLAAGKTVVSTPIRDVVRDFGESGLVGIARSAQEFSRALDAALMPQTPEWKAGVRRKLDGSSWRSTWEQMSRLIETARVSRNGKPSLSVPEELAVTVLRNQVSPAWSPVRDQRIAPASSFGREKFDYVVVGAGFAGSVFAERIATQLNKRVLVVDKREHIAGNAYDCYDASGVLIHLYGPHIFHTNSDDVVAYLSQFTKWRPYEHRVLASVDTLLVPIPINRTTINTLYGLDLDEAGMQQFLDQRAVPNNNVRTSEDIVVSRVGRELYEKFFRNYTRKQWGLDPSELDASVAGRIPVRLNTDDRYFSDTFQAMPLEGYTRMFERMLDHRNITVRLGVDFRDLRHTYAEAKTIYTGPIDEYFDFKYGRLPYRSLQFKHETHDREKFQSAPVINYPNEHDYTRITEFKYLSGQQHAKTSIVYEYPKSQGDPYYPIPRPENARIFERYRDLAAACQGVTFCGRLANYKYFNMDQVVAQALAGFRKLAQETSVASRLATAQSVQIATEEPRLA